MPRHSKTTLSIASAAVGALALVALGTTTSSAAAPDVFTITSLTTNNPVFVDADSDVGDDDGFVGITGTKFLFSGDEFTVGYDLGDLANPYVTDIENAPVSRNNWLISDFKSQTSYLFNYQSLGDPTSVGVTGLQVLDANGDVTANEILISEVIGVDNSIEYCTIFASGYGRVAIWNGCLGTLYDIELPSGIVTTVPAATFVDYDANFPLTLDYAETDSTVSQMGVVEFDGTALHIVASAVDQSDDTLGFYRYDVQTPAAVPTEVLSFGGEQPDIWELTLSLSTNQWCSGAEGGWEPIDGGESSELAFCADATFGFAEPALADTGVDTTPFLAIGGLVVLAGLGFVFIARRRAATS